MLCPASLHIAPAIFFSAANTTVNAFASSAGSWAEMWRPGRAHKLPVLFQHWFWPGKPRSKALIHPFPCWGWRMTQEFQAGKNSTRDSCAQLPSSSHPHTHSHWVYLSPQTTNQEREREKKINHLWDNMEKAKGLWPENLQSPARSGWGCGWDHTGGANGFSSTYLTQAEISQLSHTPAQQGLKHETASDLKGNYLFTLLRDVFN